MLHLTPNPSPYIPISCEFHDRLEDLATLHKSTCVRYLDNDGLQQLRNATITDVFARNGAEYLSLSSGELVRLDHLVDVDDVKLADLPAHCELR
jgi:Rho-binding antiterminator